MVPLFTLYAADALARAELTSSSTILDVATGPGTLALLAAPNVKQVVGVDFAESMLSIARERAAADGARNVDFALGDGQDLPFENATFDAAFSMFGLMFFPDRHAGFSELFRVLRPGGCAVVSSWTPAEESDLLVSFFAAIREALPGLPFGKGEGPLSRPELFAAEMRAAGFKDVRVDRVIHRVVIPSVHDFWNSQVRGSAPIALVRAKLSELEWEEFAEKVLRTLGREFGTEPLDFGWGAFIGFGRR